VDALPEKVQSIIHATVDNLNFPIDFIGSALLHAAATAIGNSAKLKFRWSETAVLWMAFIGNPGTSKSHPMHT
jgi:hypothetical protein